ncbi:MAG: choice-of-anchor D domain-containing protein, partial [Proteobacteria bacterium]
SAVMLPFQAVTANPIGHTKLVIEGDPAPAGKKFANPYPILLTQSGHTVFADVGGYYSATPAGSKALLTVGMAAPGGRIFTGISNYCLSSQNGDIFFLGATQLKSGGKEETGLYVMRSSGSCIMIARHDDAAPGGGFYDFSIGALITLSISNNGRYAAFQTGTTRGPGEGIYLADLASATLAVRRIAAYAEASPDGGVFGGFSSYVTQQGLGVNNSGIVAFDAVTSISRQARNGPAFYWNGKNVGIIPNAINFSPRQIDDSGNIVSGFRNLIYGTTASTTIVVAHNSVVPNRAGYFFGSVDQTILSSNGNVSFVSGLYGNGNVLGVIYHWSPQHGLKTIVTDDDTPPGGGYYTNINLSPTGPLPTPDGKVYFIAATNKGQAIFRGDGSTVVRIIGEGDRLEGEIVKKLEFHSGGQSGVASQGGLNLKGQLVYRATLSNRTGIFMYPYTAPLVPEISIEQAKGSILIDGKASMAFGTATINKKGATKTFTIKNVGTGVLNEISVASNGRNARDFVIQKLSFNSLRGGESGTFKITFKPKGNGNRSASLSIRSNDADENPFDIKLRGLGVKKK